MLAIFLLLLIPCLVQSVDYIISDELSLHSTINIVQPGDNIRLVPLDENIHYFKSQFTITKNGTENSRISLIGHPNIRFSSTTLDPNFELQYTHYWQFSNLTFEDCISALSIKSGGFNEFYRLSFKRASAQAIMIVGGISNKFLDTQIEDCKIGVELWDGHENIFDGGQIIDTMEGIFIDSSLRTIIQNVQFLSHKHVGESTWFIQTNSYPFNNGQHLFIGNEFIREGNSSALVELDCWGDDSFNPCGSLMNNTFREINNNDNNSVERKPWVSISGDQYIIEDNLFWTSGLKVIEIVAFFDVRGTKFSGNRMNFLDEKPENFCIFGGSNHANYTDISENNICVNGKLTNIFD